MDFSKYSDLIDLMIKRSLASGTASSRILSDLHMHSLNIACLQKSNLTI